MRSIYKVTLRSTLCFTVVKANKLADRGADWLKSNSRWHHLIMAYANDERGVTFVFSDPDTAMLFRLAM